MLHSFPMYLPSLQGTVFLFHSSDFFEINEAGLALECAEAGIQPVFIPSCAFTVQIIPKDASGPNKTLIHFLSQQETFLLLLLYGFLSSCSSQNFRNRFLLMI